MVQQVSILESLMPLGVDGGFGWLMKANSKSDREAGCARATNFLERVPSKKENGYMFQFHSNSLQLWLGDGRSNLPILLLRP